MAYCKSCGAYIPDGLSACLACGYDETAEHAAAAAAAKKQPSPKQKQSDDVREVMERHRILQQEKNRQWAEKEQERRQKQRENRRWAQEEYARRQAEREVEAEQRRRDAEQRREEQERSGGGESASAPGAAASGEGNRALAALSYMGVLFALPYFFTPDDAYAKFHARQGMKLFLFTLLTRVLKYFTPFGWIFTLIHLYLIYKGATNALNGKKEPLPYIGTIGDK